MADYDTLYRAFKRLPKAEIETIHKQALDVFTGLAASNSAGQTSVSWDREDAALVLRVTTDLLNEMDGAEATQSGPGGQTLGHAVRFGCMTTLAP